ncbi:Uncharacterised protein [Bordetella pertussis]|nr:Uncharacterised protein [Bordetella pertussis]CFN01149.1 Uncharacterised protein [Bordetella pertussis]CFN52503.1 Uncharacterised protein [Bordetella pertussis]CFO04976.1 Uncharacterised protein [Bordetella pertussis]CFO31292.1 Uncharacterised protein [Bordetella pertussis]
MSSSLTCTPSVAAASSSTRYWAWTCSGTRNCSWLASYQAWMSCGDTVTLARKSEAANWRSCTVRRCVRAASTDLATSAGTLADWLIGSSTRATARSRRSPASNEVGDMPCAASTWR